MRPGADAVAPSGDRIRVSYALGAGLPSTLAAPIQTLRTCRALCDRGVEVRILTGRLTETAEACLAFYGIEPHESLELVPLPFSSPGLLRRRSLVDALRPAHVGTHVVISRGKSGALFWRDLRRRDRPRNELHVYEDHRPCSALRALAGWRPPHVALRSTRRCRLERDAIRWSDGLLCVTEDVRDALDALHGVTCPVLVLPSGTHVPAERPPHDEHRDLDVVFAGKVSERKGVELLLEAMRFLPGRRACIVGGAPKRVAQLKRRAAELGVTDRVALLGFLPPARVPEILRKARVAVCPLPSGDGVAARYTSSLKVLEAMANGAPIVASDLPAIRTQVVHRESGLLVAPDSAESLADGIRALLENRALASTLAEGAFGAVRDYTWEQRADRLLQFLVGLADRHVAAEGGSRAEPSAR